jgi:hypothetical protein
MLLPIAFIAIAIFVILALFLIFRKASGKKEIRENREISGNEKDIIKPKS